MAVRDFIKVDTSAPNTAKYAQRLVNFRNAVATILKDGPELVDVANHNFDDSNPDAIVWTDMEALFGLGVGKGQPVFDMLNGTIGAMTGTMTNSQAVNLMSKVG